MTNVREDLNKIVSAISVKLEKGRFNDKSICSVKLFNGQVAYFIDKDNKVYDILKVYKDMGFDVKDVIKSKKLVEREKKDGVVIDAEDVFEKNSKTYIAVLYDLGDGNEYLMFPQKRRDTILINLSYDKFKEGQKTPKSEK